MNTMKDIVIKGSKNKPIALDIFFESAAPKPTIIYAHGFNGFKDWGNFDLIAEQFAKAGFTFIKFNFSHNGTTPDQPQEFVDLDAYAKNNYSTELEDLEIVIDWAVDLNNPCHKSIQRDKIFLIGHSLGGGIVLIKGAEDKRIQGIATWASVGACKTPWGKWSKEKMEHWQKTGVEYVKNSRTGQNLPLHYQLFEDYEKNKERLNVESAVKKLQVPLLLCHGTKDEAVEVETAFVLGKLHDNAKVFTLETDHVFARKHPWLRNDLPNETQQIVSETIDFFKSISGE